mmetsp:Transcript_21078/g.50846  ORF Transcript_21078/g.50846 Transcript_21078/m.50846 type:complete len:200 (-) Transcript_21078:151-750(-)
MVSWSNRFRRDDHAPVREHPVASSWAPCGFGEEQFLAFARRSICSPSNSHVEVAAAKVDAKRCPPAAEVGMKDFVCSSWRWVPLRRSISEVSSVRCVTSTNAEPDARKVDSFPASVVGTLCTSTNPPSGARYRKRSDASPSCANKSSASPVYGSKTEITSRDLTVLKRWTSRVSTEGSAIPVGSTAKSADRCRGAASSE